MELTSVHDHPNYGGVFQTMKLRYGALRKHYGANSAAIPVSRLTEDWWRKRYVEKNRLSANELADILFVGDSITQGWEGAGREVWQKYYADRRALNLGFSGDRTEHALWRLEKGNFNAVTDPKVAVVMIGTNNTGHSHQSPVETAAGIDKVVDKLRERFPNVKILLLGVFPRGAVPEDPLRQLNRGINERIAKLDDRPGITYLNIAEVFLDGQGKLSKEIMPDLLHLSPKGYALWADAMENQLVELGGFEGVSP